MEQTECKKCGRMSTFVDMNDCPFCFQDYKPITLTLMDNNKEEECKNCRNLYSGAIVKLDDKSNCVFCGRNIGSFFSPQSPVSEEWEERFEKEIIDYFWDRETVIGTQRLSLNHINKIKDFIRKQRQEAYEEGLKERCQNMLSKEETYLKAQHELAEEIMDYMENGLDEPTDWYVSVKNFLSSRGLLPKITENNI